MGRLVEQAFTSFAEEARRREIDYRLEDGEPPMILTDGDRVLQVISNLLSNALRWTPDGGRVEVERRGERHGSVAVADTGPGIPKRSRTGSFARSGRGTAGHRARARDRARAGGRARRPHRARERPGGSRFGLVLPARGGTGLATRCGRRPRLRRPAEHVPRAGRGARRRLSSPRRSGRPGARGRPPGRAARREGRPRRARARIMFARAPDLARCRPTGSTSGRNPSSRASPICDGRVASSSAAVSASDSTCSRARASAASSAAGSTWRSAWRPSCAAHRTVHRGDCIAASDGNAAERSHTVAR